MTSPLATAFVLIRPTTAGFGPTLKRDLEGQAGAAGAAGKKTGAAWTKGFQSSGVTKAANRITEGIAAAGVASVVMAAKFQSSMEKISTQAGVSQGKIKGLSDGILQLAGKVGFSPDSLATSLYHVESSFESLGITSKKALQLVKIAAEGAAVGGADLEDVTNALTAVMASGIKVTHGMSGAMGVLNQIVGVGDMKMQDLADAFGTGLLASIKGFGVSITDAGAALATFGDNNIRGAKAGQQLRMAIQALAAPTGAGKKILEGWGLSVDRFAKDMQKGGLRKALEDLQAQFKKVGLTGKEQGQVLTELFGKRAGVGIQILVGQMDRFQSKYKALAEGAGTFGDAWAKTQATAAQQGKELGHGLEALGVSIGEKLLPPLMSVFGFIRTHTSLVLTLAGVVGGLAVAVSAVSFAIRVYETYVKVAAAVQWLWNAALDANPIGLVIVAIAALVAGIIYAYKHFKWFRDFVNAVWQVIQIEAVATWHAIVKVWDFIVAAGKTVWHALQAGWTAVWHAVADVAKWFADRVLGFFGLLVHGAADAFGWIPGIGGKLKDAAAAFDRFHARVDAALSFNDKTVNVKVHLSPSGGHILNAATGMRVPGYGGGDKWPAMLEGGEAVVPKHLVPAIAPFLSANRVPGFAGGGIAGGVSVHGAFPSVPAMAAAALAIIRHLAQANVTSLFAGVPGSVSSYSGVALQVLRMLGQPAIDLGVVLRQMQTESGGNPLAVNKWDSNWLAGHPSVGLMQVIGPTFAAYAGPFRNTGPFEYGVSVNPLANIFAGLNYAVHRYGAAWTRVLGQGHGYDSGGFLPPGLSVAYNGTGRPEAVIPSGRTGGRPVVIIQLGGRGGGRNSLDALLREWFRRNVRVEGGGDVQVAFGGG